MIRHWKFVHDDGVGGVKFCDAQTPVIEGVEGAGALGGAAGAKGAAEGAVGDVLLLSSSP